ncbi:YjbF family lipoprotein [Sagittula sp. SSi028]|uniref:YjbF family lipoprotein n=1 Tax=Sagittula sp. SSi028 TaxID=3400636 RepID=UPI003AF66497
MGKLLAMNTLTRILRPALAATLALTLAACGNNTGPQAQAVKSLTQKLTGQTPPPAKLTAPQIAQVLQSTKAPVALFVFEKRDGAQGLLTEIETNGAYATFGNQNRNVIVLRDGMVTATRGLGGDLMSVEEDQLLSLITARAAGQANYAQRFLTPEGVTATLVYLCTTRLGNSQHLAHLALGPVDSAETAVTVDCVARDATTKPQSFSNVHVFDSDGIIVRGRQWLGEIIGFVELAYVRN